MVVPICLASLNSQPALNIFRFRAGEIYLVQKGLCLVRLKCRLDLLKGQLRLHPSRFGSALSKVHRTNRRLGCSPSPRET